MLALLSPAKKLDFDSRSDVAASTLPRLTDHTKELVRIAKTKSRSDLMALMDISENLADLNYHRFQAMGAEATGRRPAALAFKGDTYVGLQAGDFDDHDMDFAQNHLRILSGLYGVLRPMDLIEPYRLEMGTRLGNPRGKDLYGFWGTEIATLLKQDLARPGGEQVIVNLASNEYFKAANAKALATRIITPVFKQDKDGMLKSPGMMVKRARGAMARFMVKNRLTTSGALKDFKTDGYAYRPELSSGDEWVFVKAA